MSAAGFPGADDYRGAPDGGPAFPKVPDDMRNGSAGMTLRDYFAGQALAGVAGNPNSPDQFLGFYEGKDLLAEWAYAAADAMLLAREDASLAARDQTP